MKHLNKPWSSSQSVCIETISCLKKTSINAHDNNHFNFSMSMTLQLEKYCLKLPTILWIINETYQTISNHINICPLSFFFHFVLFYNRKQALAAKAEAEKEGIVVPLTLEDYCIKPKSKPSNQDPPVSNFEISIVILFLVINEKNQWYLIV